ncbi:MAG: hypothetical protein Q4A98_08425 [Comamonadaceae bacterium]|nr:hypothetical protein [Comamonadaceae bacterium]
MPPKLRRRLSALLACGAALTVAGCATHTAYEQPWQADGGHGYGHYHRQHPDYRHYGAGPWYEPGPWPRHRYYGHDDSHWRRRHHPGYAPPGYYRPDAPPHARIRDNEAQARQRERQRQRERTRQLLEQPFHERDERTAPAPRRLEPDFP